MAVENMPQGNVDPNQINEPPPFMSGIITSALGNFSCTEHLPLGTLEDDEVLPKKRIGVIDSVDEGFF